MPLDNTTYYTPLKTLAKGFDGLRQVSTMLRGAPPPGFTWDFEIDISQRECGRVGCALGWVYTMWPKEVPHPDPDVLLSHLGLGEEDEDTEEHLDSFSLSLSNLFGFHGKAPYPVRDSKVTPAMVAGKLEELIREYDI